MHNRYQQTVVTELMFYIPLVIK